MAPVFYNGVDVTQSYLGSGKAFMGIPTQPVLWTPAEITTFAWYDAADGTTFTLSGSSVDQWNDKSGNAYHMSGSGATRPVRSGSLNSESVVFFDGGDTLRAGIVPFTDGDTSLYVVGNRTGRASQFNAAVLFNRGSSRARGMLFDYSTVAFNGRWGTYTGADIPSPSGSVGSSYEICEIIAEFTANTFRFYQDGVNQGTNGVVNVDTVFTTAASFLGNEQFDSFLQGNLAEVLFFNYKNSDSEREQIEGYLAWKWGLEGSLPADHPYKNSPPLA